MPGDLSGDGSAFPSLSFSIDQSGGRRRPSARHVLAICLGVVLLPCFAIGFFWAAIALVNGL